MQQLNYIIRTNRLHGLIVRTWAFNSPIDYLPTSIAHMHIFLKCFEHSIDCFSARLLEFNLSVRPNFAHPLDHLPTSLQKLCISTQEFHHPLDHLPSSLQKLRISTEKFNNTLDHLPSSLSEFQFRFTYFGEKGRYPRYDGPSMKNPYYLDHLLTFLKNLELCYLKKAFPL